MSFKNFQVVKVYILYTLGLFRFVSLGFLMKQDVSQNGNSDFSSNICLLLMYINRKST